MTTIDHLRNHISISLCPHPAPLVILTHTLVVCRKIARELRAILMQIILSPLPSSRSSVTFRMHCYFPCLLLSRVFFFFLLPQSGDRFERSFAACTISARCELRICACACTRLHTCILLPWTTGLFFLFVFFSVFPQHHGWPHSADTCVIFFFRFKVSFFLLLLVIFVVLLSV